MQSTRSNVLIMNTSRVKQRLQTILKQRGVRGLIGLQQSFDEFDLDKNGTLSWEEFNLYVKACFITDNVSPIL